MSLEFNSVEAVLKKIEFEQSISKLVELTEGVGVKKGENHWSRIQRFKAKLQLGSGRHRTVHLIVKNVIGSEHFREFTANEGCFVRETLIYRDVLPVMQDILEETGDIENRIWPKCLASRPYDQLIFEDLGPAGYTVVNRKEQLNLQRSLLVIRKLAKFHALSKILVDQRQIALNVFGQHSMHCHYSSAALKGLSELVKAAGNWGEEWKESVEKLEKALPDLAPRIDKALKGNSTDWVTLNHGDCWTNNILFKNEPDSDYSVDAIFLDMQLCFIGSPAYDLNFFMVTSVRPENITNHLDAILQKYTNSLKSYLQKFGYTGPIPTLTQIEEQCDKLVVLQLAMVGIFIPKMLGEEDVVPSFEEIISKEAEARLAGAAPPVWANAYSGLHDQAKRVIKRVLDTAISSNVI